MKQYLAQAVATHMMIAATNEDYLQKAKELFLKPVPKIARKKKLIEDRRLEDVFFWEGLIHTINNF